MVRTIWNKAVKNSLHLVHSVAFRVTRDAGAEILRNDVSQDTSLSLTFTPPRLFQSDTMQIRGPLAQISAVVNKPSNLHIYHAYDSL